MEFVVVTGLSGAGKTNVLRSLEDMGFYCVDNLPPQVLSFFWDWVCTARGLFDKIAVVVDPRSGEMFNQLQSELAALKEKGCPYTLLFLEASNDTLIMRYKESRRQHPLAKEGALINAIALERQLLAPIKKLATHQMDTTGMRPRELKKRTANIFSLEKPFEGMLINVVSFGFKYGIPLDADLVFDVRFLPNPFYVPELKAQTGLDRAVAEYVHSHKLSEEFLRRLFDMMEFLLPEYINEGKTGLVVGVGCTGGRHRSVTCTEALASFLLSKSYKTITTHRDIDKT